MTEVTQEFPPRTAKLPASRASDLTTSIDTESGDDKKVDFWLKSTFGCTSPILVEIGENGGSLAIRGGPLSMDLRQLPKPESTIQIRNAGFYIYWFTIHHHLREMHKTILCISPLMADWHPCSDLIKVGDLVT